MKIQSFFVNWIAQLGLPIPLSKKTRWEAGIQSEIRHWDKWLGTKGLDSPEDFNLRLDPDSVLQPEFAALLPAQDEASILDVGAGPLTLIGKKCAGKRITITAVDLLADEYDRLLDRNHIRPVVRTLKVDAEKLADRFPQNTFDLACALNSIDHVYDPEKAILQMLKVVKIGAYVFLRHTLNEADHRNYLGLHQSNFSLSEDGDFLIRSKSGQVNMTKKYLDLFEMTNELVDYGNTVKLVTRIRKKADVNL